MMEQEDERNIPALSGTALALAMQFPLPKEIASCRMTCTTWRDDLDQSNGFVWKQAALNFEPNIVRAVIDDAESREEGESVDFYRLAASLSLKRSGCPPIDHGFHQNWIDNLLVFVEIKRRITTKDSHGNDVISFELVGVYSCGDCSDLSEGRVNLTIPEQDTFVIEETNFFHASSPGSDSMIERFQEVRSRLTAEADRDPNGDVENWQRQLMPSMGHAARSVLGKRDLVARAVLVRRDSWRTARLPQWGEFPTIEFKG